MELRNIYSFLKVVEKRSFSKAAEELGYNQSSVTIQIQNLENELNAKLFDRIGKKIYLTQKGKEFYEYCLQITRIVNEAIYSISQNEEMMGILRIGCIESIENSFMRELIYRYHQKFPYVQIQLQTGTSTKLLSYLKNDQVDFICTLDHPLYGCEWVKYSNTKEPIIFIGPAQVQNECLTLNNIDQFNFLLTEEGESYRYILERVLAENNKSIIPILETGNTESIKKYIMKEMGIGFLPYYTVEEEIKKQYVQKLDTKLPQMYMWLQLIYHKNKTITCPIKEFLRIYDSWIENHIKSI